MQMLRPVRNSIRLANRLGTAVVLLTMAGVFSAMVPGNDAISFAKNPGTTGNAKEIDVAMSRVFPALVRIFVVFQEPSNGRMRRLEAAGSGAIISPDGYVVTNHHVAGNATRIVLNLANHEEVDATLVGTDAMADISVLKIDQSSRKDPNAPLPVAEWGNSDELRVGDVVLAMGSPGALSQSVTEGIISNTAMILPRFGGGFELDGENVGMVVRWLAHDAVIFHGNSGGPLVNLKGEIIGINEIGLASLGGAIPSNLARSVVEQIIKDGHVNRSWLGLDSQPRLKGDRRTGGALVAGVIKGSPADQAGLKAGDLITTYNQQTVNVAIAEDIPIFNQLQLATPVGAKVAVVYQRDGQEHQTELTTIARHRAVGLPQEIKGWGITGRDITRMMAQEAQWEDTKGVYVDTVRRGGPVAEAKLPLKSEDVILKVNGKAVADVDELRKLSAELSEGKTQRVPVIVNFRRGTQQLAALVKIGEDPPEDKPNRARKPWPAMATQVLTADLAEAMGIKGKKGVRVTEIFARQSAEAAGVKVGDVIVALDDVPVEASQPEDVDLFDTLVRRYRVGTDCELSIIRDGKPSKLSMKLDTAPQLIENAKRLTNVDFEFAARDLAFDDRNRLKLEDAMQGVLIENVEEAGWASLGGLSPKDVLMSIDDKPTATVDQLKEILEDARKNKARHLTFFTRRGVHTFFLEVEPDWK